MTKVTFSARGYSDGGDFRVQAIAGRGFDGRPHRFVDASLTAPSPHRPVPGAESRARGQRVRVRGLVRSRASPRA